MSAPAGSERLPLGESVYLLLPGRVVDPFSGEEVDDWSSPVESELTNCAVAASASSDDWMANRNPLDVALIVYVPYVAEVPSFARMRVRGTVFDVYGEAHVWRSPYQDVVPVTQVALRVREG